MRVDASGRQSIADVALCTSKLGAPAGFVTSRPCNRFPCPNTLASWSVGPWEPCAPIVAPVRPCDGGAGATVRTVECRSATGSALADGACGGGTNGTTTSTGIAKPYPSLPCTIAPTCDCTADSDCPSTHWVCDAGSRRCACGAQWGGDACDVPLLLGAEGAPP